ncbi:hypothetical protein [Jatrophihabitans endophyticus]|uniref:hypothetical protein n=1 Tax=Jatrophihabitans endophyticus TaxID=1206085 RepID=UPI001A0C02AD|nr:hypothetical protein [Jatrophihabitans endophyticus]MBE7189529.1 hypothetical protein [Jatrophihabitans endophyticus]
MRIIRRLVAGSTALALGAAALTVAGSPASAHPSPVAHYYPLAGNSQYLVYSKDHAPNGSRGYTGCSHGSPTLHVRTKSGRTHTLPVPHTGSGKHYSDDVNPCYGLDLTGHFLTLEGIGGYRDTMYWWDLEQHTHGKVQLPGRNTKIAVVGTVSGGWLFANIHESRSDYYTATTIYRQGTGGKVTTYAKLARFSLFDVETSAHGLLVGRGAEPLRYLPAGSSKVRTLDAPAHAYGSKSCFGLTSTYAACQADHYGGSDNLRDQQISITPLTGGPTVASTRVFDPASVTLDQDSVTAGPNGVVALVYRSTASSGLNDVPTDLRSFDTGGRVHSASGHGATALVVAYDKIIVAHRGGRLTSQGSVTGAQHTLLH